jgi:hypothetical protein
MKDPSLIIGVLNISCGILFVLLSIPLAAKKIPMNNFYGFRISKAFESEENWYEINRYGGRQLLRWSILLAFIGVLYFIFPIDDTRSELANTLLAVLPILICPGVAIVKTLLFSKQLSHHKERKTHD